MKHTSLWQLLGLLTLAFLAGGCQSNDGDADSTTRGAVVVDSPVALPVHYVSERAWPVSVEAQGVLVANEISTIGSRLPGRVVEAPIDVGDLVQAGQTLLQLETTEYLLVVRQAEARLQQARAAVGAMPGMANEQLDPSKAPPVLEALAVMQDAKNQRDRLRKLSLPDAISEAELQAAEAAVLVAEAQYTASLNGARERLAAIRVAEAELAVAQRNLEECTIAAPFDGAVQNRAIAVGSFVTPGQTLLTLAETNRLRFRGAVPERYSSLIQLGKKVDIQTQFPSHSVAAKVSRIAPIIDPLTRSIAFEVGIENPDQSIAAGSFATARVILDESTKSIAVPRSALIRFAGVDKVWVVSNGICKTQTVEIGRQKDGWIEILSGLQIGTIILQEGESGKDELPVELPEISQDITFRDGCAPLDHLFPLIEETRTVTVRRTATA